MQFFVHLCSCSW